ncbi:MAG: hypothetical protein M3083_07835, partial [Actinomycetota bacterium]|nr:hypothetical protein [Actinomycetota bacterium]
LRPRPGADGHDMFLAGLAATVAGIFHDVDGGIHVAVTVDGDRARELYAQQGRFYYFHPDELEPVPAAAGAPRSGENGAGTAEGAVGEAGQAAE